MFHSTHAVSARLQFSVYAFQFLCVGGDSICPGVALDYVLGGWVGESCVLHVTHLFLLQVYPSSFGTNWQREMVCHFSQCGRALGGFPWVWGPGCHRV
jgi:hypothetical protein